MNDEAIKKFIEVEIEKALLKRQTSEEEQVTKIKFTEDEYGEECKIRFGLPSYSYYGEDAGADLPVVLDREHRDGFTIFPGDRAILHSGMIIELPKGYWCRIIHRSSTEKRHRLRVIEGVIDSGYRAEMLTQVHNSNTFPITIKHGQRIAQFIVNKLCFFKFVETNILSSSARDRHGFGSSGV